MFLCVTSQEEFWNVIMLSFITPIYDFFVATFLIKLYLLWRKAKYVSKINDECSSWYNRVSSFLVPVWNRRKENLPGNGSACMAQQNNLAPECVVNGTECYDDAVHAKKTNKNK